MIIDAYLTTLPASLPDDVVLEEPEVAQDPPVPLGVARCALATLPLRNAAVPGPHGIQPRLYLSACTQEENRY